MKQTQNRNDTCDMETRYKRAQILECGVYDKSVAFNTTLFPHWIGNSDMFWYTRETRAGQAYRIVDAESRTNTTAFDHNALAKALAKASTENVKVENLLLTDLDFIQGQKQINFSAFGKRWIYDCNNKICQETTSYPKDWTISPDGKKAAFARNYNLWVKDLISGEEKILTHNGERFNEYATAQAMSAYGNQGPSESLEALWSPDSKRIFTLVVDIRKVEIGPPLVQHVPTDGSLRPKIIQADRRVAFPEDEHIESYQFLAIEVESGQICWADYRPCPVVYPPYAGYFTGRRGWWDADGRHTYFIDQERGGKVLNLVRFDTHSGHTQVLIQETSDFAITQIPISHLHTLLMPLQGTNELIWFSERSGWAHLYLYEMSNGKLKNPITQGDWLVRNVLHFNTERRELFIQTAGREKGRNPYYCDICRVNIDSGELITILSSDHEYVVCDQRSRITARDQAASGISPSGRYLVTTRSRVDEVPVSLLLSCEEPSDSSDKSGAIGIAKERLTVEVADVSGLPKHWKWPEPVILKAADGKTDVDGVIFRPTDFDPKKSYPILDCSYGYVGTIGSFTNNSTGNVHYLSPAAYSELGFIVVCINNRGNDGLRNTTFSAYQSPDLPLDPLLLRKYHKADCIAGIKQLAKRYPYMDLNRVGIVEFGSIPMALAGMLVYPDFYKVGVSINAMADSRMVGALGMHENNYPQLENFTNNLRGKLLIIIGMLDWAVPAAITFRLVEALKNSNKRFDMLALPNLTHGTTGYTTKRSWDYVVEHLLNVVPPENFQLTTNIDGFVDLGA